MQWNKKKNQNTQPASATCDTPKKIVLFCPSVANPHVSNKFPHF